MTRNVLAPPKSRLLAFVIQRAQGTPAAGGVINFNLIALTTQLILADYLIHLWNARTARILPRFEPKTINGLRLAAGARPAVY